MTNAPLGLIAGRGQLPHILFERMSRNAPVVVATLRGQSDPERFPGATAASFPVAAVGGMVRFFLGHGVSQAYMAGGVERGSVWRYLRPDVTGAMLLPHAFAGDDSFLRRVADTFARRGVAIGDPTEFISDLFAGLGLLAGPAPDSLAMLEQAFAAGGEVVRDGRGQAALFYDGRIVATEDRRGTDAMLRDAPGPGAIVVKRPTPGQDRRFDVPTIGPETIRLAAGRKIQAICVMAGEVLILQFEEVSALCEAHGVSLIGL